MKSNRGWWGKVTSTTHLEQLFHYIIAKHPPTRKTEFVTTRKATDDERREVWKHVQRNQIFAA